MQWIIKFDIFKKCEQSQEKISTTTYNQGITQRLNLNKFFSLLRKRPVSSVGVLVPQSRIQTPVLLLCQSQNLVFSLWAKISYFILFHHVHISGQQEERRGGRYILINSVYIRLARNQMAKPACVGAGKYSQYSMWPHPQLKIEGSVTMREKQRMDIGVQLTVSAIPQKCFYTLRNFFS